jgi:hypothetical protein
MSKPVHFFIAMVTIFKKINVIFVSISQTNLSVSVHEKQKLQNKPDYHIFHSYKHFVLIGNIVELVLLISGPRLIWGLLHIYNVKSISTITDSLLLISAISLPKNYHGVKRFPWSYIGNNMNDKGAWTDEYLIIDDYMMFFISTLVSSFVP